MENLPKKSVERKPEEIVKEADAGSTVPDGNGTEVVELCDDVFMGEVVPGLPWYNRQVLLALNRRWVNAMTESFPFYARLTRPRILCKSLVLFHTPSPRFPHYNSPHLWVYCFNDSILVNLQLPEIPEELQGAVKFVCDDNQERIYAFTLCGEEYDVSVVDLREGNSRWKKLPPLPLFEGKFLFSCSSFDKGGSCTVYNTIWKRSRDNLSTEEDEFSVWALSSRNDNTELQSQWQPQLPGSSDAVEDLYTSDTEKPPLYLETNISFVPGNHAPLLKWLYRRCSKTEYCTHFDVNFDNPGYLLLFYSGEDDKVTEQRPSRSYILCHVRASERVGDGEISFYIARLDEQNSRIITEESEVNQFLTSWDRRASRQNGSSAIRVLSREAWQGCPWQKNTFKIGMGVNVDQIKLAAQKGSPSVYRCLKATTLLR